VNAGPGVCGDATHICQVTTNAKGLVTSQSPVAVASSSGGGSLLQFRLASRSSNGWELGPDVGAATGIFIGGGYGGSALFGNSGTQALEIRTIPLPPTWAGGLRLLLAVGNDQGGSGTVKIAGRVKCIVSSANFVAAGFGSSASQILTTNGQTFTMASIPLDASACGAGNYVDVEISRDNTVAGNYGNTVFVPSASLIVQ
jgi:hypothetical protein